MFKWASWFGSGDTEKEIVSPNGRNKCTVILKNGQLFYKVERDNKPLIGISKLGFEICGEPPIGQNLKAVRMVSKNHDETIEMLWGEDKFIKNHYRE